MIKHKTSRMKRRYSINEQKKHEDSTYSPFIHARPTLYVAGCHFAEQLLPSTVENDCSHCIHCHCSYRRHLVDCESTGKEQELTLTNTLPAVLVSRACACAVCLCRIHYSFVDWHCPPPPVFESVSVQFMVNLTMEMAIIVQKWP